MKIVFSKSRLLEEIELIVRSELKYSVAEWNQRCHGVVVFTTAQLHSTKPKLRFCTCLWRVRDSRWWGSLTVVPAGKKAKCLSLVNHTTKLMLYHHHHHHHHQVKKKKLIWHMTSSDVRKILELQEENNRNCETCKTTSKY